MISSPKRKSNAIMEVWRSEDFLYLRSQRGILRFVPQRENVVRVTYTELDSFSEDRSLGICCDQNWADWSFCDDGDSVTLALPKLKAVVNCNTGSVSWYDADPKGTVFPGNQGLLV